MLQVNLMAWRQRQLRQRWRKRALSAGVMLLLLACWMSLGIRQQQVRLQRASLLNLWPDAIEQATSLRNKTRAAQKQLDQQRQRQQQRSERQQALARWMHFIQRLGTDVPADSWINALKKNEQNVVLHGFSRSVASVHLLRDRLLHQSDVQSVRLGMLQREPNADFRFRMTLVLQGQDRD